VGNRCAAALAEAYFNLATVRELPGDASAALGHLMRCRQLIRPRRPPPR